MKQLLQLVLAFICLLFASCKGCNGDNPDTNKVKNDTSSTSKLDTVHPVLKEAGISIPKDTIQTVSLEVNYSCEDAKKKLASDNYEFEELSMLLMKIAQCKTEKHNQENPNNQQVVVYSEEVDENGNGKILFNTISLKTGEDISGAAKALIGLSILGKTKDPVTTVIAGVAGDYAVDSYLDAAKKNDPLIILFPTVIPGKKLTSDIYKSVTKLKIVKKVDLVISKGIKEGAKAVKTHPEDVIAPTVTIPIKVGGKVVKKVGGWLGL